MKTTARIAARMTLGLAAGALAFGLGTGFAAAAPVGPVGPTDIAPCPPEHWNMVPTLDPSLVPPVKPVTPTTVTLIPLPPIGPVGPQAPTLPPTLTLPPPVGDPIPGDPPILTLPPKEDDPCGYQPPGTLTPSPDEPTPEDEPSDEPTPSDEPGQPGGDPSGPAAGSDLAYTGANAGLLTAAGISLLGGGAFTVLLARLLRRRVG